LIKANRKYIIEVECSLLGNIFMGGDKALKNIGKTIRKIREERKMTLEDLAKKLEKSTGYLSKLENGKKPINLENLHKIAAALDVDVVDLFPNKEKVENPFTGDDDWLFVVNELKEKGFSASEVYLKLAREVVEKDKKSD
jgi:transcriptional regulator with XRE-family HTH domain